MDANELIEKGTRAAYATYDDSVEWDEAPEHWKKPYKAIACAIIAITLKAAAEEIESQLRTAPQCEICGARIVNSKRLRTLAEQVETEIRRLEQSKNVEENAGPHEAQLEPGWLARDGAAAAARIQPKGGDAIATIQSRPATSPGVTAGASDADRASRMLMEAADFFAATRAQVDPRAWEHLLVYAPKTTGASEIEELCKEIEATKTTLLERQKERRARYFQANKERKPPPLVRYTESDADFDLDVAITLSSAIAIIRRLAAERDDAHAEAYTTDEDGQSVTWRELCEAERSIRQFQQRRATDAEAEVERLRAALKDATAHLAAATSSYRRFCRKGVTGDALFSTKLSDYQKATNRARTALEGKSDG